MLKLSHRIAFLLVCAVGLWAGILAPLAGGPSLAQDRVRDSITVTTLDNGLTVVLAPKEGSRVATVNVWIGVGSAMEPPELSGISHFFEHMIFKGSDKYPQVDTVVEGWGGSSNASTSLDWTQYYITSPAEHIDSVIELMADILINGNFAEEDLILERDVVLREGDQRNSSPGSFLTYQVYEMYYGDHPYAQPILGTEETVSGITREDFLNWLDLYYVPNNMTVLVAGGIDSESALQQVQAHFGDMAAKELPAFEPIAPPLRTEVEQVVLNWDSDQERLRLVWPGPEVKDFHDVVAMDVLLFVLSGNRSSRFYQNIVRDLGVITSADANYFTTRLPGNFQLSAQYPPEQASVARSALLQEINRIREGQLTQEEVDTAKTVLLARNVRGLESSLGLSFDLGFYATVSGDPRDSFEYMDRIRDITVEDVVAVAQKYVKPNGQMEFRLTPETAADLAAEEPGGLITLDNGLRLILREDPTTQVVAFEVLVGTGTAVETSAQAGISSFTNSLMLRGTESQSEEEIFDTIENLGASLSQSQLPDMGNMTLVATADTWPTALPVLLDVLKNPAFAEEEFDRLKRDTLLQIEAQQDSHFTTAYDQLLLSLYGNSGYGNPDLGTEESMEILTLDQVKEFYASYYVPSNMVVTVIGNIDAELMAARLGTAFGTLEDAEVPTPVGSRQIELAEPGKEVTEKADSGVVWLVMGFPGPAISHDDYSAMKILNSVVGSGASSRLFDILRGQQGLAYSVGSFFPSRAGNSHLAIYAIVAPDYGEQVVDDILAILQDIRDNGVRKEELQLAVQREVGDFLINTETTEDKAFYFGWFEMLGAGHQVDTDYPERMRAVTSEDVQRVAATYLENYVVSIVQPPQ